MKNSVTENNKPFVSAIIVSAGNSSRMGGLNKQFLKIDNVPVIVRSVSAFQTSPFIDEIIIVTREMDINLIETAVSEFSKVKKVVIGGSTRQQSVFNGISACSPNAEFVAVHDGARPLVSQQIIENTILSAFHCGAATTGVKVKDTVKIVNEDDDITSTPDRAFLRFVQTPQVFSKQLYLNAMNSVKNSDSFTDDCMLIEAYGHSVKVVEGDYKNIKITTPEDILTAEIFLRSED